ncbi:hypothetical protein MSBR3_0962 [Methanosarcina barkeri 3]|uniref:Uncharacterized protein n=2 Tax=Methanosarcina barkeri TaxID=2208 RepID=A0A0E3WWB0_METBA|nr:hypothetical protein MSBR3_0962 [Methanosarcina barkeri 3]
MGSLSFTFDNSFYNKAFSYKMVDTIFHDVCFSQTDVESARSLISTIIQGEAAIIAIVFTLSLIAVQQTTSTYSPRVIDIFNDYKKNKPFFMLLCAYTFCIACSALLLKVITSEKNENIVTPSIEHYIWIVCALFILSIIVLLPYINFTLNMFKPTTLIKLLSENISKQSIEFAIELESSRNIDQSGQIKPIDDTIQPIVDVLQGAMKSYDYETTRYGLKIIEAKAIQILSDERYNTGKEAIAKRIIDNIRIIGIIATKQEMEKAVNDTVDTFFAIFECLIDREIYEPIDTLISALFTIGEQTINENIDTSTVYIFKKLTEIGIKSTDSNLKNVTENMIHLIARMTLEKISMENKQGIYQILCSGVCLEAFDSLGSICEKTAEKKWEFETSNLIYMLKIIGTSLFENTDIKGNADYLLDNLLSTLESITQNLIKNDLKKLVYNTTSIIHLIGKEAFVKNKRLTEVSCNLLDNISSEITHCSPEVNGERDTLRDKLILNIMTWEGELNKLLYTSSGTNYAQ